MPPVVRPIRVDELPALLELYRHLHPEDAPLPPEPEVAAVWAALLADPKMAVFVAEAPGGHPVASCTLAILPNLTRGCHPYGLIENVVTHADYRRQGYGTAVLQHTLACAWQRRCYKVLLMTGSKKESTLRFYDNAGFVRGDKTGFVARPPVP